MKTDTLFYELFRLDPRSLFRLVRLKLKGVYAFESITVKSTEKRFDGFFKRTDGDGPNIFLEVQGWNDPVIYWRLFREICTWYEQTGSSAPFIAIVLFVDKRYDPGKCPLSCPRPNRMVKGYLPDLLGKMKYKPGALTVLKPLVLPKKKDLSENVKMWKSDIKSMELPENEEKILTELLEYSILQRFPKLSLKEVKKMIELTPLDQTVAGLELIEIGVEQGMRKGVEKGVRKGKLIGEILFAQRILKQNAYIYIEKDLELKDTNELKRISAELELKFS